LEAAATATAAERHLIDGWVGGSRGRGTVMESVRQGQARRASLVVRKSRPPLPATVMHHHDAPHRTARRREIRRVSSAIIPSPAVPAPPLQRRPIIKQRNKGNANIIGR